ncbi:MAG: hypothetical protein P8189_10530 [Anaerolineae bacterium]
MRNLRTMQEDDLERVIEIEAAAAGGISLVHRAVGQGCAFGARNG